MKDTDFLHEDLVDEKVAAGLVAGLFFVGSVLAGAKIRAAVFSLLAPVLLVYALPHAWRFLVRTVKAHRARASAPDELGGHRALAHETVPGRAE